MANVVTLSYSASVEEAASEATREMFRYIIDDGCEETNEMQYVRKSAQ